MQTKQGFTLVEMLVTLAIISVLMLLTIPLKNHKLFEQIELLKLKKYLESAHLASIELQDELSVSFSYNAVDIGGKRIYLQHCSIEANEFKFLNSGNANKSFSSEVNCKVNNYTLIVHLGSGHIAYK